MPGLYEVAVIRFIYGENAYLRDKKLAELTTEGADIYEAGDMSISDFRQAVSGVSMFGVNRAVVKNISENKTLLEYIGEWVSGLSDDNDVDLVLVDQKPDKRTKAFTALKKKASLIECKPLVERGNAAAKWLEDYTRAAAINLERSAAAELVSRVGVDQYALVNELSKLSLAGDVSLGSVGMYTPPTAHDTALVLFEMALKGDRDGLREALVQARQTADPYMTLGLLTSQLFALSGAFFSRDSNDPDVAKMIDINPYVLKKFSAFVQNLSRESLAEIVEFLTEADVQMKTTSTEPWVVLQTCLNKIASQNK